MTMHTHDHVDGFGPVECQDDCGWAKVPALMQLKIQCVLVNEEGEEYETHDNFIGALATLYEYPNDSIRISLVRS